MSENAKTGGQLQKAAVSAAKDTLAKNKPSSYIDESPGAIMQKARKAPASMSAASVLSLQRALGNRAVAQLMSDQAPSRSNQTGIPDNTLTQMESSLNADFSNVRIHPNSSKASDVNALAYTQGNDIHFAPGQYDTASSQSRQILGHELTHVIQQRQGRVKPTMQLKGMQINDDAALEHEADVLGARAASSDARPRIVPPPSAYAGGGNAGPAQRKVTLKGKDVKDDDAKYEELKTTLKKTSQHARDVFWDVANSTTQNESFSYEWTLLRHFRNEGEKVAKQEATRDAFKARYKEGRKKNPTAKDSDKGWQEGLELTSNLADSPGSVTDVVSDTADRAIKDEGLDGTDLTDAQNARKSELSKPKDRAAFASGSLGVTKGLLDFILAVKKGCDTNDGFEKFEASIDAIMAAGKMGGGIASIVAATGDQNASKGADILGAIFEPINTLRTLCKGIYDSYKKVKEKKQSDKTEGASIFNDFYSFAKSGISAAYNIFKVAGGASDAFKMVAGPIIGVADSAINLICDLVAAVKAGVMKHRLGKQSELLLKRRAADQSKHDAFERKHSKQVIMDKKVFSKDRVAAHGALSDIQARIKELVKLKDLRTKGTASSGQTDLTKEEKAELKSLQNMESKMGSRFGFYEKTVLDKEHMGKRRLHLEKKKPSHMKDRHKAELEMLYEHEEEDLIKDLTDINQDRIVDNSVDAVFDLTALLGNILTIVGGPAASAGAGLVMAAKIGSAIKSFLGKANQTLRDYLAGKEQKADAALEREKAHEAADLGTTEDKMKGPIKGALHSQLVNTEKSSSAMAQKYKRDIMILMRMISRLPSESDEYAAEQYQRVEIYLQATGVDIDSLAMAKDNFDDAMGLLVKAMMKRKILG
mgnify:CR=1 FL=1